MSHKYGIFTKHRGLSRSIKAPSPLSKNITIKTLNGSESISLRVCPNDTVKDIKERIKERNGIPINEQRLIFTGQRLMDDIRLSDYNIFDGCTLQIVLKLYVFVFVFVQKNAATDILIQIVTKRPLESLDAKCRVVRDAVSGKL